MKNPKADLSIGIFDSGIGGISVLADLIKALPDEEFIYYADTLHFPYGNKPVNDVRSFSIKIAEFLSFLGIKILLIACNTATSAAIREIRDMFTFPVIGMEPAIKQAVAMEPEKNILVMATPLTLKEKLFNDMINHYKLHAEIIPLPCPELAGLIGSRYMHKKEIEEYLDGLFRTINLKDISIIVLACTHYILIKKEIKRITGGKIKVIDGNTEIVKQMKSIMQREHLLKSLLPTKHTSPLKAKVKFYASNDEKELKQTGKQLLRERGIICQ